MYGDVMGLLNSIGMAVLAIGRLLGFGRPAKAAAAAVEPAGKGPAFMPAVAGFVQRARVDRFRLAARLTSVARLNTPLGRKPRIAHKRPSDLPAVPVARLGAKKLRLNANHGPRVLKPAVKVALPASNVVPFPAAARAAAVREIAVAKAA